MGTALLHAIWSFLKHYVAKRGFLDGLPGFVIALEISKERFIGMPNGLNNKRCGRFPNRRRFVGRAAIVK